MKKLIVFLLCTLVVGTMGVFAQATSKQKKAKKEATTAVTTAATTTQAISANNNNPATLRGDRLFKKFAFPEAAAEYKAALKKDENNIEAKEKLVRTYLILNDYVNAEPILESLANMPNAKANNKLLYGFALRANKKYKEADAVFNEYALLNPGDARAAELANGLATVEELQKDNGTHTIQLEKSVNSDASDFGVAYYKDNSIVFSSNKGINPFVGRTDNWTDRKYYDLFVAKDGKVKPLDHSKEIKTKYHEGPVTFNSDFSEMILTRDNWLKGKTGKSKDKVVKLKLYTSKYDSVKGTWGKASELPFNSSEYSVGHPSLSKDGKRLYFVSDMPGGLGETDLYVSYKETSGWGTPTNLGKGINTPGREMFPYISNDGTLYFASDSRTGLGALDVYSATFANGEWGNVTNLGTPINSEADDFNYVLDANGKAGYFTSNRTGGAGDDDIYTFQRNGVKICGVVVDAETNLPLQDAKVNMLLVDTKIASKTTDAKGNFCFTADPGKEYKFEASKETYETNSTSIKVALSNPNFTIPLSPVKEKPAEVVEKEKETAPALNVVEPSKGVTLVVCVKERGKGNLAGASVEVEDKATGAKKTCVTGADCKCSFVVEPNKEYFISAFKDGYSTATKTINTKGEKVGSIKYVELTLDQLREGLTVRLDNIYYDLDKWNIRPDAAKELNNLVNILNKYPAMQIELSSHTDSRASDEYNLILSAKRALSCVEYLQSKGIDMKRILAVGYGETHLTNKCSNGVKCTSAEHQQNRRTEFKILKMK